MRILIANVEEPFVEVLQTHLHHDRHQTRIAFDGLECLELLESFAPNVLLLDSLLPWGGSEGVLAEMDADPLLRTIPVVHLGDSLEHLNEWDFPNVVAKLQRPLHMTELVQHLTSAVYILPSCAARIHGRDADPHWHLRSQLPRYAT